MQKHPVCWILTLIALLSACAPPIDDDSIEEEPTAETEDAVVSDRCAIVAGTTFADIDACLESMVGPDLPGAAYGYDLPSGSQIGSAGAMSNDQIVVLASVSKMIAAAAIVAYFEDTFGAQAEAKLRAPIWSLSATFPRVAGDLGGATVPSLSTPTNPVANADYLLKRQISVFHFLTHTSGIHGAPIQRAYKVNGSRFTGTAATDLADFYAFLDRLPVQPASCRSTHNLQLIGLSSPVNGECLFDSTRRQWFDARLVPDRDAAPYISGAPLRRIDGNVLTPGTTFEYSSQPFTILSAMIEEATGLPFNMYVKNRIFSRLGMNDSFYYAEPALTDPAGNYTSHPFHRLIHDSTRPANDHSHDALVTAAQRARIADIQGIAKTSNNVAFTRDDYGDLPPMLVPTCSSSTNDLFDEYRCNWVTPWIEGGVYSTVGDLLKFLAMLRTGETPAGVAVLGETALNLMLHDQITTTNTRASTEGRTIAGVYIREGRAGTVEHNGRFFSRIFFNPRSSLAGVILTARHANVGDVPLSTEYTVAQDPQGMWRASQHVDQFERMAFSLAETQATTPAFLYDVTYSDHPRYAPCTVGDPGCVATPVRTNYAGCFTDDSARALDDYISTGGETIESCVQKAIQRGWRFAGVQYYGHCFGGNNLGYVQVPDAECNTPCTANSSEMCGGAWRNSIYDAAPTASDLSASHLTIQLSGMTRDNLVGDGTELRNPNGAYPYGPYRVDLDGVATSIRANDLATHVPTTVTIEAWARPASKNGSLFSRRHTNGVLAYGFSVAIVDANNVSLSFTNGSNPAITSAPVTKGSWHHLVATMQGTQMCFWVDGTKRGCRTGTLDFGGSGSYYLAGSDYQGAISRIAAYDRVLNTKEIMSACLGGHTRFTNVVCAPAPSPAGSSDTLAPNQSLLRGQGRSSLDGTQFFVHQTDGNVVLYDHGIATWQSHTAGQNTNTLLMQGDGNLVLYSPAGAPLWSSSTENHSGAWLIVRDDGKAVIESPTWDELWSVGSP